MTRHSWDSEEPKKLSKEEHDKLIRKLKRQRILLTTEQLFRGERRMYNDLILQNCRDRQATKENLRELLGIACEWSVKQGKPLVKIRNPNGWRKHIPSDDPEPDTKPTASGALRMRGMGIRWE